MDQNQNMFADQIEEAPSRSVPQSLLTIVYGGLCVGLLDGLAATVNAAIKGVSPDRVFHYIASGLIGREASYSGGAATILLGISIHFAIAFTVVALFLLLSKSYPVLLRHAPLSGMLYGIAVHLAMAFLIVPLSAVPKIPFSLSGMMTSIVIHMCCVGLPTALIVRSMSRRYTDLG